MRVGIVGSRSFNDYQMLISVIKERLDLEEITLIVSGGAEGADSLAQDLAKNQGLPILIYYPKWELLGPAAGPKRNEKIVKASEIVFAFWDGRSRGTKSTISIAEKYGIECIIKEF
jgi:hypothetical protein